jgi:hypothetical protein
MHRLSGLLVAGSLIALLAGCVPSVAADVQSARPSEPVAVPTPDPTVLPRPDLSFGGDCSAIFTDGELGPLVGAEVGLAPEPMPGRGAAVAVLGGTSCTWADASGQHLVWLTVIPAEGLDEVIVNASKDQPWCYGGDEVVGVEGTCSFSTVIDGYWLSGVFNVASASGERATDGITALSALLGDRAAVVPATVLERPERMWTAVPDCPALAARVDTPSLLGGDALNADRGSMGGAMGPGFYGSLAAIGHVACIWSTADGGYRFETVIMPGAGWVVQDLVESGVGTPANIDGTVAAASVDHDGTAQTVFATDGVNLVEVTVPIGNVAPELVPALVSALMRGPVPS